MTIASQALFVKPDNQLPEAKPGMASGTPFIMIHREQNRNDHDRKQQTERPEKRNQILARRH
jgi:hypothetical protein